MTISSHSQTESEVRFLVVDDHPLIRRGIESTISQRPNWSVIAAVGKIIDGKRALAELKPDVAIVDLGLPDGNGLELIQWAQRESPATKILVSSMRDETLFARQCIREGASGFIAKQECDQQLVAAIEVILGGELYLNERIDSNPNGTASYPAAFDKLQRLSARELLVFELLGSGLTTTDITKRLNVRPKTVDSYRERIKAKLEIATANELLQHATRWTVYLESDGFA